MFLMSSKLASRTALRLRGMLAFAGGALNPARAFGPALASHHWLNQGTYWVGPLGGGFVAGLLYDTLFLRRTEG